MKTLFIFILTLSFSNAMAKARDCANYDQYTDIVKTEMKTIVKTNKATIIDVNTKESFEKSRIPGSLHFYTHQDDLAKVLPKDKNAMVVAYCGGKLCTAWKKAAKMACEMGYKNIRHFNIFFCPG